MQFTGLLALRFAILTFKLLLATLFHFFVLDFLIVVIVVFITHFLLAFLHTLLNSSDIFFIIIGMHLARLVISRRFVIRVSQQLLD